MEHIYYLGCLLLIVIDHYSLIHYSLIYYHYQ